jgi:hypothetical protein
LFHESRIVTDNRSLLSDSRQQRSEINAEVLAHKRQDQKRRPVDTCLAVNKDRSIRRPQEQSHPRFKLGIPIKNPHRHRINRIHLGIVTGVPLSPPLWTIIGKCTIDHVGNVMFRSKERS